MKITKDNFHILARSQGFGCVPEFKFCDYRKFRADWLVTYGDKQILVEYEGVYGKSRHVTMTGYSMDCEKYNLAQKLGFIVLRYTVINFKDVLKDLEEIILCVEKKKEK